MARVPIAQENRTGEGGDKFPRLKLTEKGQKSRFTVFEAPWREWVHYIKAPEFDDQGRPVRETRYKKNGDPYTVDAMEFISQPICLGSEDALAAKGLDPKNCPACEASEKSGGDIPGPVQRFAVNVIEYTLRGSGFDVREPFSAEVKVWSFTGRIYDEIEGIQREIGDLRQHDITLECEDPGWQRNKLAFKMEPGHKYAPRGYIKELLSKEGNKATDAQLRDACGRDMPRTRMQEDCDLALRAFRKLRNEGADAPASVNGHADLAGGIDELLGEETKDAGTVLDAMTPDQRAKAEAAMAQDDPFSEFALETTSNPPREERERREDEEIAREKAAAAASPASSEAAANPGDFSFDDLLGDAG
jgi:hypothetical protein